MQNPIVAKLAEAARKRGSAPLITWYGPNNGRTELSVRSFANWVDKTANLLSGWEATGLVVGEVNLSHPGHWMSLIWPVAAWQAGCGYTTDPTVTGTVVVLGPEQPRPILGRITVACSLHPLGLGAPDLPAGVEDFSSEALAQSDAHYVAAVEPTAVAWLDALGARNHTQLLVEPVSDRVLVRPTSAWQALAEALIAPLLGGGSAVVVEGEIEAVALARLVASERITATVA